ncbi:tRNA (guanosine(46)-N7)-methyltransferase TrmB [Halorhodospira abdelmalekii]|uniref:tRNA (guanosine(46)-N7)-methyltransferase TrmB n=1 Tax=Halorhodospira abdelmalekii TaxID=421629 RepID=UPI001905873B|nr:tRNA (guanosine(46)-N7)-methyltransferase TrmB [Halorhodospira abdelmalekii]MBK1734206.1 tRNA (guanosine(46)-N7)-methyltransferase TrmB [Halorhodospira abdelmalekii]
MSSPSENPANRSDRPNTLLRPTRSFVRREGRLTRGQAAALERLWPRYGVESEGVIDLDQLFGRNAERVLDIGFGNGEALVAMAAADPARDYLGVEVHRPGIGHCLRSAEQHGLGNLRLFAGDAVELLRAHLPERSLAAVHLFFPDPWPKKRHHKRRLLQPAFLDLLVPRLTPGAILHLATDWEEYALAMLACLEADARWVNLAGRGAFLPPPPPRPRTKFERRGLQRGHTVYDLRYRLV